MTPTPKHRSSWTSQSDTLGLKALPIMEELRAEGRIVSFDEEHRLDKVTGHAYRADYYAILANGMALDVEVDYTAQHGARHDFRRDRDLAENGISTVRINQIEINGGTAKQKIIDAIETIVAKGVVLDPGSTRVRKKEPVSPINHALDSVGLYVAVSERGTVRAASIELKSLELVHGKQLPKSTLMQLKTPLVLDLPSKEEAIAAAICHPAFLPQLPFCNLCVYLTYAQNSFVFKRRLMKSTAPIAQLALELLSRFNLNYLFTVSAQSCRGAKGNFGVLGKIMNGPQGARQAAERERLRQANDDAGSRQAELAASTQEYLSSCEAAAKKLLERPHFLSVRKRQEKAFLELNESLPEDERACFDEESGLWHLPDSVNPDPFEPWDQTARYFR